MARLTSSELQSLQNELTTDPEGLGYGDGSGDLKEDADLGRILNQRRSQYQMFRTSIPMGEIYAQIDWINEWVALSNDFKEGFNQLTSTPTLDASSSQIRSALEAIFGTESTTWSNLASIAQREASRAEDLFGQGITITMQNLKDARNQ